MRAPWVRGSERDFTSGRQVAYSHYSLIRPFFFYQPWPLSPRAVNPGPVAPPSALHRALRRMAGLVFHLVFWVLAGMLAGACQRHGVGGFLLCDNTTTQRLTGPAHPCCGELACGEAKPWAMSRTSSTSQRGVRSGLLRNSPPSFLGRRLLLARRGRGYV